MSEKNQVEVIIETPKGSRNKYIWDEQKKLVRFKKCMPLGFIFPFDFGMVPGTKAEDGDPIDVLLLMEEAVYPGVFMDVRIIAALKADQEKNEKYRNDRLIAVESTCPIYGQYQSLNDLTPKLRTEIEKFFESYNHVQEKKFTPLGWADAEEAMALISQTVRSER